MFSAALLLPVFDVALPDLDVALPALDAALTIDCVRNNKNEYHAYCNFA
jgi:hypothetical protein